MNRFSLLLISFVVINLFCMGGCITQQQYYKQTFICNVQRTETSLTEPTYGVLKVDAFSIVASFAGQGLITRTSSVGYQSDFYNEFLVAPEYMLTDITREWLRNSGLFVAVIAEGNELKPDYLLTGTISKLHGDFSVSSNPKAVVEVNCTCLALNDRHKRIIFTKIYKVESPIIEQSAQALVTAYSESLRAILNELEHDIKTSLSENR